MLKARCAYVRVEQLDDFVCLTVSWRMGGAICLEHRHFDTIGSANLAAKAIGTAEVEALDLLAAQAIWEQVFGRYA
jgi:hypothetical protein